MKNIIFGFLLLAMTACAGNETQSQSPTLSSTPTPLTIPNVRPIASAVVSGSELEDLLPEEIKHSPPPTFTPEPLEPLQVFYDLPEWVKTPETAIAAALISNELENTRKVALFNAATGEDFEILLTKSINGYFWFDNQNLGFLAKDLKTIYRLNLTSGTVFLEEVSSYTTRLLKPDRLNGLEIIEESWIQGEITLVSTFHSDISRNGTYTAHKKSSWEGITIINNVTNETILDLTTPDKTYATTYEWSPTDNDLLVYVQGKSAYPSDFITKATTLNIVDVSIGKTIKTFSGDFGDTSWSPDGKKILFEDARSIYRNYGIAFTEAPCIIFLNLDEQRCLRSIPRNVPQGYSLATTTRYKWSLDSERIFYSALYYKNQEGYSIRSNICVYDLNNGHIECPTRILDALIERDVSYTISPDEHYLYLCMSKSTSLNDYADESTDGIIQVDGSGLFTWQGTIRDDSPSKTCSATTLWRPMP